MDMKVLFISHVSNKLGAARSLLDLMDGLRRKGVECCVIIPSSGRIIEELERRGIVYSIVPLRCWASINRLLWKRLLCAGLNLFAAIRVAIKAKAWQVDIIYSNSSVTPVGALAAFLLRKPHIWHIREFGEEDYNLSFDLGNKWSRKLIDRLSYRIIVISEALKRKYSQYISSTKIQVIYDGVQLEGGIYIDPKTKQGWSKMSIPTLVVVGLLHPGKGQIDAVLAVAKLVKRGISVRLRVVGDGDPGYLKQLKQAVVQNGIEGYIEFTGYADNIVPIMKLADIVVVCSRSEAFGRVTVEGMLCGKPVIGTRSGATPELIKEGFNGLLYEPGNPEDLAAKIKHLIDHPEEAKQMGANGLEWASKQFTVQQCAGQVFDVLQEAVRMKRR